jgi:type II secretory pathway pseudopilin PulG
MSVIISKKGQVWVETVIYTLIGLAIIGLVLAGALPKINEKKDEIMITHSIDALRTINDQIYEIQRAGVGNKRIVTLDIKSGSFIIDMGKNTLSWNLDSNYAYSEVDSSVEIGSRMNVTTTVGNPWNIELISEYSMDIRYNDEKTGIKQFDAAPTPYNLVVSNEGKNGDSIIINFIEN